MRLGFERIENLKNIGPTVARNLRKLGIETYSDLQKATPAKVYLHLKGKFPERTWPVCYYLYSLEGALRGVYWDDLPQSVKDRLMRETGST